MYYIYLVRWKEQFRIGLTEDLDKEFLDCIEKKLHGYTKESDAMGVIERLNYMFYPEKGGMSEIVFEGNTLSFYVILDDMLSEGDL